MYLNCLATALERKEHCSSPPIPEIPYETGWGMGETGIAQDLVFKLKHCIL